MWHVKMFFFSAFCISNSKMRFELVFLDAVDPSLGRVDHESLPQQALMEMLIYGIKNKEKICGHVDEPRDIEVWGGVTFEDDEVVAIVWGGLDLKGSLHLEWLPSSVRELSVRWNNLTGALDLACLPASMKKLNLGSNGFTGSISLERLPKNMEEISVFGNHLSGTLKLETLPDTLTLFDANTNKLSGNVYFTQLPAALVDLAINENRLSGSVVLTRLPGSLEWLIMSNNQFSGDLDLTIPFLDWGRAHEFDGRCVEEAGSTRNASTAI